MPPTRRVTDQPVNDEVAEKRREPEQNEAPAFDPKARGAALRAAFLKAAHPEVVPEPKDSTEPEPEAEAEADSSSEPEPEAKPEAGLLSESESNVNDIPTPDEGNEAAPVASETMGPSSSSTTGEQQKPEETIEETKTTDKADESKEVAEGEESDFMGAEQADEPLDSHPVAAEKEERLKKESEERDIKPQIERELFAEYVVFEEEERENQQDEEQAASENDPAPEPESTPESSKSESPASSNDVSLEEEVVSSASIVDEKPVPAPVPIIEEVKATVIDEPSAEKKNNQVMVKPQKLGFFARLKLLFSRGKKH